MERNDNWKKDIPLFLLIIAIGLSPSFGFGNVPGTGRVLEIRVEDILLVLFGLFWIARLLASKSHKLPKPPLWGPILLWLGIGLFTTLGNLIIGNIATGRAFFYFLKEIQFFVLYFYIFYHIRSLDTAKRVMGIWFILGLINVSWVIYQFIVGIKVGGAAAYGPSAIPEPEGPLPSGGFFLLLFIMLFHFFLYYYSTLPFSSFSKIKKLFLFALPLSLMVGIVSSGSRTSVLTLGFAIVITPILFFLKRGGIKAFALTLVLFILLIGSFYYFIDSKQATRGYHINPSDIILGLQGGRTWVWRNQVEAFLERNAVYLTFGLGKSASPVYEESHSQYVRNLVETGIVGSAAFFFLMGVILKKTFHAFARGRDPFLVALSAGAFVSTLAMLLMAVAAEVFLSVKINEVYWSMIALAMAVASLPKEERTHYNVRSQ